MLYRVRLLLAVPTAKKLPSGVKLMVVIGPVSYNIQLVLSRSILRNQAQNIPLPYLMKRAP